MSSMLEQAIIEAEQLKKVASRNAEQAILERYSQEIKKEMEDLIEQDLGLGGAEGGGLGGGLDMGMGTEAKPQVDFEGAKADADKVPDQLEYAAFNGVTIGETKYPEQGDLIEINLDSLSDYELNPKAGPTTRNISESIEIDDSLLDQLINEELEESEDLELDQEALEEMIKVDYRSVKEGNPFGTTQERDEMNLILADLKAQCDELNMKNESLSKKNKKVLKENAEYKKNFESAEKNSRDLNNKYISLLEKIKELKGTFEESQLMNTKLAYTNKVLSDEKLNIRQKNQIAESIEKTDSVNEAKIVYETLVNTVESTSKRMPESLSEAVTRRKHPLFIKGNQEGRKPSNDFANRMMRLAGIDK